MMKQYRKKWNKKGVDITLIKGIIYGILSLAFILFIINFLIGGDNLSAEPAINTTKDVIRLP